MDTMKSIPAHMRAGPIKTLEMLEAEKQRFAAMQTARLQAVIGQAIAPMLPAQPSLRAQLKGSTSARALLIGGA